MKQKRIPKKISSLYNYYRFYIKFCMLTNRSFRFRHSLAQIMFWQEAIMCMIFAFVLVGVYMAEKGWPLTSGGSFC
jgi:hypothetical protein